VKATRFEGGRTFSPSTLPLCVTRRTRVDRWVTAGVPLSAPESQCTSGYFASLPRIRPPGAFSGQLYEVRCQCTRPHGPIHSREAEQRGDETKPVCADCGKAHPVHTRRVGTPSHPHQDPLRPTPARAAPRRATRRPPQLLPPRAPLRTYRASAALLALPLQPSQPRARPPPGPAMASPVEEPRPLLANRYALQQVIGEGAYGVVASASDVATGQSVAVKRIRRVLDTYPMATRILRELKFLRLLSGHENVIEVKDILVPSDRDKFNDTFVVFELMPCDLYRVINSAAPLNPANVKFLMFQLLRGVHYMHSAGVLHRDLKPSNVLVDAKCRLKICDFGLARAAFRTEGKEGEDGDADVQLWTDYVATRWYRAPELLVPRSTNYGRPIDMWSAGCIFAEMILRRPLFPGEDSDDQLRRITELTGKPQLGAIQKLRSARAQEFVSSMPARGPADLRSLFPSDTDPAVIRLVAGMLEFDPEHRITAREALMDDYFTAWRDPLGLGPPPRALHESEFEFEKQITGSHDRAGLASIRRELLEEILHYHPDKRDELLGDGNDGSGYVMPSQSEEFARQMDVQGRHRGGIAAAPRGASMPGKAIKHVLTNGEHRHVRMAKLPTMPENELAKYKAGAGIAAAKAAAATAASTASTTVPPTPDEDRMLD
jgi:serine/threonine protein kinase